MDRINIIPLANDNDTKNGWKIDFNFLKEISEMTKSSEYFVGMEEVELVLIAFKNKLKKDIKMGSDYSCKDCGSPYWQKCDYGNKKEEIEMPKIKHDNQKDAICSLCRNIVNKNANVLIDNKTNYIKICRKCAKKILKATEEPKYFRAVIAIDKVYNAGHLLQCLDNVDTLRLKDSANIINRIEFNYSPGIYIGRFYLNERKWDVETEDEYKITWDSLLPDTNTKTCYLGEDIA